VTSEARSFIAAERSCTSAGPRRRSSRQTPNPAEALIQAARDEGAELILVG